MPDFQFPSPKARDFVSFGLDDFLHTAASDSEDFGPALADALPPSSQEARPSAAYSELVEVLSRATEKLALDWPDEPRESRASKLDDRFLIGAHSKLERRKLPFFSDLHREISSSWKQPFSSRLTNAAAADFTNLVGSVEQGYTAMPVIEDTLASHLSPSLAPSWKSRPLLPSKPCRTTSALIGKSYIAAGQAGMALHTMAILQAYQADVLKEMDEGTGLTPEAVKELRRATDLALRATKHTARAVGRSMAASVAAERHLWLNLTEIREREKTFLMDAPISQSGLFGEAVSAVVDKFRLAKTQSAALNQFMPRRARVLPFGLALAPRTFTKCMDAALAPLRLQGIRVLNYLDDWLILAHSRELVSRHRDIVLGHIHSLGLRMNAKKSVLLPSQRTVFLGVRLDSVQMQARLAPARIPVFTACLAHFKLDHHVSVGTCRRLLGLMAAASPVLPLGLLHMRPFLWWMKELRLHPTVPATRLVRVSRSCCRHLLMWRDPVFLRSGVRMGAIHRRHMITTDASMTGWGAVFEGRPASGEWKEEFLFWHINCLELRAVFLALKYFLPVLGEHHVIVRTDNMAVVSHINRQGGSRSRTLDRLARHLLLWSQDKFLSLRAVHVPGVLNLAADFLSRQKLKPGEWMLNRQTVSQIWDLFGKAEVDLFASQESSQCPLWFSLSFPTTLGIDAFAHPWPNVSLYAFPPIKLIPAVLCRVNSLLLIAPFWPSQTWFSELTHLLYRPPWEIPIRRDLLSQLQGKIWHPQPELWKLWVWPIQGQGL